MIYSSLMKWMLVVLICCPSINTAYAEVVAYIPKSTKKVCQLTGDLDCSTGKPTLNQTNKRFGVLATDLGSSFEHTGKLFFLFGDTWGQKGDRDVIAWSRSIDPEKISLEFPSGKDGKWLPLTIPGIKQGAFEIPSGGISINGVIYIAFTTDHSKDKTMGRSVIASSLDDGLTFKMLYDLSRDKFINVSFWLTEDWLYIYGSGDYRKSSVCLARVKPKEIEKLSRWQYFSGTSKTGETQWSEKESEAVTLFRHDVVGEFSVAYLEPLKHYIMLYNSEKPRGITLRSSSFAWGPWSEGTILFDPWSDNGYGHFMHISSNFKAKKDALNDPNREQEWGGEYGPYIMSRFTKTIDNHCRIYYTMSTWNPYQVVVMQSDLELHSKK